MPKYFQDLTKLQDVTTIDFRSKDGVLIKSFEYSVNDQGKMIWKELRK